MDYLIFQQINSLAGANNYLDDLAVFFAKYLIYILIAAVFLLFLKRWKAIFQSLAAAFLAKFIIIDLIKFLWERPRPYLENNVNQILEYSGASFPSGHTAVAFALAYIVYRCNKKTGILFFIASFLIAVSRIFVGIHWPSDVLAGVVIGIFSGWLILKTLKK